MRDWALCAGAAAEGSCWTLIGKGVDGLKKYWLSGALLLLLLLTLSGCFFREPEDLYQSPEQSADYLSLTQTIRNVKDSLAQEYGVEVEDVSVMSGDNTALIQLQDLDRDGERETAVTFFRVSEAEKPLKIYFFTRTAEDTYTVSAMVEGNGTAIYRVDYVDLNGSGCKEVVVSWQMSTGVYLLGAYSLEEAMVRSLQYAASAPAGSASAQGLPDREALRATEWMSTVYDKLCPVRSGSGYPDGTGGGPGGQGRDQQRGGPVWLAGRLLHGAGLRTAVHGDLQRGKERRGDQLPQGGRRRAGPGSVHFK